MKVVVIGGGAAGMACAYFSARNGSDVVLLEKNEKLGKKVYITGKGRCNVTNDSDFDEFMQNVVTNPRFMIGAVRAFSPQDTMSMLEELGLNLKVERGNRVFPYSDKSSDVIKAFERGLKAQCVEIRLNTRVSAIKITDGEVRGVYVCDSDNSSRGGFGGVSVDDRSADGKEFIECDRVVVCTGGVSYPTTGSTGDGYAFAKSAGHTVEKARACLCGLYLKGNFTALAGLSLKNIGYSVYTQGKKIYDDFGELLFTHKGVSGPVVLSSSSYISSMIAQGKNVFTVSIDLKPALDDKTLDKRVLKDFGIYKNKTLKNSLVDLMPRSLIPEVIRLAVLDGEKSNSIISKEERTRLVNTIKDMRYEVTGLYPIEEAIVTGGGVNVKEISPSDMESKLVKGLRFAGEVLDVDALTGGFNLQCAFSTAFIAAKN
ncbi:MAG: NAD(P)/FAD-dependent oxidoreductase [Candidatus Borkfalkiaceae bacterium]|nr:NAD(P)/FAD-dependent oxidoreductase [Christensenellaceae bacterium]